MGELGVGSEFGLHLKACESNRKTEGTPGVVLRLACCYRASCDSSYGKPASAKDTKYGKLNKLSSFDQV